MLEFTGERIVPGKVDEDLFHEHISRYRFVDVFSRGKRCLDAGCGTGYGTALLAGAAHIAVGVDIDLPTVASARQVYGSSGATFTTSDVTALPFPDASFDLTVCFEVVEHLQNSVALLHELARVTSPSGIAVVSTPNRDYYNLSRGESGPNPFHQHEFDFSEFVQVLERVFSNVRILGQNAVPAIFLSDGPQDGQIRTFAHGADSDVKNSQFYVAVCSQEALPSVEKFAYLASSGNVLMERARHISLLQEEIATKTRWLEELQGEQRALHEANQRVESELAERSAWALQTTTALETRNKQLAETLDKKCTELATAVTQLHEAEKTIAERTEWAKNLDAHVIELGERIQQLDSELSAATESVVKSNATIQELSAELEILRGTLEHTHRLRDEERHSIAEILGEDSVTRSLTYREIADQLRSMAELSAKRGAILESVRQSRWLRLGRALGLGPDVRRYPS